MGAPCHRRVPGQHGSKVGGTAGCPAESLVPALVWLRELCGDASGSADALGHTHPHPPLSPSSPAPSPSDPPAPPTQHHAASRAGRPH